METKISFDQFADSHVINNRDLDSATVYRAAEIDVDHNHSEMLAMIADLVQSVRDGDDDSRIVDLARLIADEYETIAEMETFACDPVRELMGMAQCASLEETPIAQMGRA